MGNMCNTHFPSCFNASSCATCQLAASSLKARQLLGARVGRCECEKVRECVCACDPLTTTGPYWPVCTDELPTMRASVSIATPRTQWSQRCAPPRHWTSVSGCVSARYMHLKCSVSVCVSARCMYAYMYLELHWAAATAKHVENWTHPRHGQLKFSLRSTALP